MNLSVWWCWDLSILGYSSLYEGDLQESCRASIIILLWLIRWLLSKSKSPTWRISLSVLKSCNSLTQQSFTSQSVISWKLAIHHVIYTRASTLLPEWLRYFTSQVSDWINSLEASSLRVRYRMCGSLLGIWSKWDMNRLRICVLIERLDFITVF